MIVTEVGWWVMGGGTGSQAEGLKPETEAYSGNRKVVGGCGTGDWRTKMAGGGMGEGLKEHGHSRGPPGVRTPGS